MVNLLANKIESHGCIVWHFYGDKLPKFEYEDLSTNKITWCVYKFYDNGNQGIGQMLFRRNGKWGLHDMCYNSCNTPLENICSAELCKDFNEMCKKVSGTWLKEVIDLIDFAKEHFEGD